MRRHSLATPGGRSLPSGPARRKREHDAVTPPPRSRTAAPATDAGRTPHLGPTEAHLHRLRDAVREGAENRPGLYRMTGPDGELLYVGKSVRVRTRLLSYFRASPGEKAAEILRSTAALDWEYVSDEFGALLREMRQIHHHRPRYNVVHKRKRAYAFVKLTAERAPRLLAVRTVRADGATYFGPFPAVGRTARTIRELGHGLGLRDCPGGTPVHWGDQLEIFEAGRIPRCLRADMGTCLAPCCGRTREAEYRSRVEAARRFLEGRGDLPLRLVRDRMRQAAARLDFEYAELLKERLERLTRFREELTAFRGRVEGLSFVYRVPGWRGDDRIYLVRRGRVRADLPHPKTRRDRARAARRIEEVWSEPAGGPAGMVPEEAGEILLLARWFRLRPEERERTLTAEEWLERKRPK